jgi:hypothetical protein
MGGFNRPFGSISSTGSLGLRPRVTISDDTGEGSPEVSLKARTKMKLDFLPEWIMRTRLASPLCMAATIMGCAFVVEAGFGREPAVTLEFSTFLGSTGCSYATLREATVDSGGNILAVGRGVYSPDGFSVARVHTYGPLGGGSDIIVVKLKHDGTEMLWVALLGGTDRDDGGYGICVDANDDVYIAGKTRSGDFPTTRGAFDETYNGGDRDGFLCKLRSDGTRLIYSTYLGGSKGDSARGGLAIDDQGCAYVAANTFSGDDYLEDATSRNEPMKLNGFTGSIDHPIVKVSPDGKQVEYCRFLGDLGMHLGRIALDARGRVYVNDWVTNTKMYVSPNAAFPTYRGGQNDGAFHIFSNDMRTCLYSTFLGGSGDEISEHRIAVHRDGTSSLVGYTNSKDLPTVGRAHQRKAGGGGDGYLAKFAPDGQPEFITYIGGSGDELLNGPALDDAGRVFVTGFTTSADFEVTPNSHDSTYGGGRDMFLQIYGPTGQLLYSTFMGMKADDQGRFVTTDARGNPIVVGRTLSRSFPTTSGAHDRDFAGSEDLFCLKFSVSWAPTSSRRLSN